ncbi:Molybdenum-dependent transcriptional regulator [Methanococcoides burtonii DSM 6242]|uniref:Molybdenum-dependent transcriptional regulator n=2 Tax=Methanococcoides burtonii TaxID=29291 RepID=Q12U62_METBU|nr:Molybdenum-dependent transcriptional regulator [Methanococcoides burtonii DSM 6242]
MLFLEMRTKVWLTEDGKPIIGAGKVKLLKAIDEERSLRKACSKLDISYKHAWLILKKMNERVGHEVVTTIRGGKGQGTFLTDYGKQLISEYEDSRSFVDITFGDETSLENISFKLSAHNKLSGRIVGIDKGNIVSKVKVEIDPDVLTSIITSEALERLDVQEGDEVFATIKSTEVVLSKADGKAGMKNGKLDEGE